MNEKLNELTLYINNQLTKEEQNCIDVDCFIQCIYIIILMLPVIN